MFCIFCGTRLNEQNRFCHKCGRQTGAPETPSKDSDGPTLDGQGRAIIRLKGGSPGFRWGVNGSHGSYQAQRSLAGKAKEEGEFSKSVKVRLRLDPTSQFPNSILVETQGEEFLGWILRDANPEAFFVLNQIHQGISHLIPQYSFPMVTFEVSARVEGYWDEPDPDEEESDWEVSIDQIEVRVKNPAEIDV